MKTLLYIGFSHAAEIIAIRPNFEVCYFVDTDSARSEYLASLFRHDPKMHVIHVAPSSVCGRQFYEDNGIDEVDTLVISPGGGDRALFTALGLVFLRERLPRVVGIKVGPGTDGESDEAADELTSLLARHYETRVEDGGPEGRKGKGVILARWWRKAGSVQMTECFEKTLVHRTERQHTFNCVYFYLRDSYWTISQRGNVRVIVSSTPQQGCDLYFYHDAFSFRGKQAGYDVVLIAEPLVVLPGQYNEDVWAHFDHGFTFCDAPIERDSRFTKVLSWMGDWSAETVITEDLRERERLYPIEGRQNSICMINGNKCSWVSGELYSKRAEAALWFCCNSDMPFDVYGRPPFLLPNYKGGVLDEARLSVIAQYRYNWCFENTDHPVFGLGYVAEKILDCLETRTVPIYLGNPNIENYVPKECFIDFRDFGSYAAVNDYLHRITDDEYMAYIENIDKWVAGGGLRPYSWQTLYNQLTHWYSTQTGLDLQSLVGEETRWEREMTVPKAPVALPIPWTFDDLRFRPSQFMDKEDLLKTRPWEKIIADANDRFQRTMGLASQEKYNDALRELALTGFSRNVNHHLVCAQLMQLNGLQGPAFVQLSIALELDPGNSYTHNQLGVIHFQKSRLAHAEEEFRKAVDLDNGNHLARKNLAFLLLQTGRKREAMPMVKSVEPYFPEEVRGWKL